MAIEDNASIALIPSGYKSGKLYSVIPDDGDGDFTHSRGSTATRVAASGLIETVASGVPRLDYPLIDGVVQDCPALLLEPSRTNLLPNSQEYGSTNINTTTTRDVINAPDGTQTADRIVDNSVTGEHLLTYNISTSIVNGTTYSFSVFFKSDGSGGRGVIRWYRGSWDYAVFNLELGAVSYVSSGTASIENYGNGWYRCSFIVAAVANYGSIFTQIGIANSSNNFSYAGASNLGVYFWGTQFETGSYETSYIPTSGSTVTRSADVCNGSGTSAEFNDSKGVLFTELQGLNNLPSSTSYISISDGSSSTNAVLIQYRSTGELRLYNGGTVTANMVFRDAGATLTDNLKIAIKYGTSTSNYKVYINGVSKTIESAFSATSMSGLDSLQFAFSNGTSSPFEGKCKQLIVFNESLSDSDLETLTSWDSFNAMAKGQQYTIE